MKCSHGHDNPDDQPYCGSCGDALPTIVSEPSEQQRDTSDIAVLRAAAVLLVGSGALMVIGAVTTWVDQSYVLIAGVSTTDLTTGDNHYGGLRYSGGWAIAAGVTLILAGTITLFIPRLRVAFGAGLAAGIAGGVVAFVGTLEPARQKAAFRNTVRFFANDNALLPLSPVKEHLGIGVALVAGAAALALIGSVLGLSVLRLDQEPGRDASGDLIPLQRVEEILGQPIRSIPINDAPRPARNQFGKRPLWSRREVEQWSVSRGMDHG